MGFWIALERCTEINGALSFLPGSHLTTPITKRFVRLPSGGTGFESMTSPVLPKTIPNDAEEYTSETTATQEKYVLETCEPGKNLVNAIYLSFTKVGCIGDLVIIHGSVLHKSEKNTSSQTRYAYTFHMIDSPPHAEYDEKNWLQPTMTPFPKVLDTPNEATISTCGF